MEKIKEIRTMIKSLLVASTIALTGAFTQYANAETTRWQDLGGGKARLVTVFNPDSGYVEGIVEIELLPGWTTYWRNPGEAGIPPVFDFSLTTGVVVEAPEFPVPITKVTSGIISIGYSKHVAFPFKAQPLISPLSGKIKLDILLGVCEVVCIPAVASFEQDLAELNKSDPLSSALIEEAKRRIPMANNESAPQILDVSRKDKTSVIIRASVPASASTTQLFAEGKSNWFFNPAKIVSRKADIVEFELNLADLPEGADLKKHPLRLTLAADEIGSEKSVFIDK